MDTYSLYVHVPFCVTRCRYCGFVSQTRCDEATFERYLSALAQEIWSRNKEAGVEPVTVYFGGGTPSALGAQGLEKLLWWFRRLRFVFLSEVKELTVELNPDDVDASLPDVLFYGRVTRVSLGAQTFNDALLRHLGRRHDAQTTLRAYETLRRGGVNNISLDLMWGLRLPGDVTGEESERAFERDVKMLTTLQPEHISAYNLSIEPGTPFEQLTRQGEVLTLSEEAQQREYEYLCHALRQAGYQHYEVSNWAKPGYHALHNERYWQRLPYHGFGPGAVSLLPDGRRLTNTDNLEQYIENPDNCFTEERLTPVQIAEEDFMLPLRTAEGLPLPYPDEWPERLWDRVARLLANGDLVIKEQGTTNKHRTLAIAEPQWFKYNTIVSDLLVDQETRNDLVSNIFYPFEPL